MNPEVVAAKPGDALGVLNFAPFDRRQGFFEGHFVEVEFFVLVGVKLAFFEVFSQVKMQILGQDARRAEKAA